MLPDAQITTPHAPQWLIDEVHAGVVAKLAGGTSMTERAMGLAPPDRLYRQIGIASLLVGAASLIFALALLVYLLWLMAAPVRATPFDSDGVRCYSRAVQTVCIKTANP
jgi:tellurite resistance protein TehA-like permease